MNLCSVYFRPIPWVLLYAAWRLFHILVTDPRFLMITPMEELYRGMIAKELAFGPSLAFWDYRADNYSGGSLVIGILASLFFKVLGPTLFALKLAPLLIFCAALYFWHLLLLKHFNARIAATFSVLFTFSSPAFTGFSMAALGDHAETIFFTAFSFYLLYAIIYEKKNSWPYFALLGFILGFSIWFAYIASLTFVTLGFFAFIHRKNIPVKRIWILAVFFILGISPWIYLSFQTQFSTLVIHGDAVYARFSLNHFFDKLLSRDFALIRLFAGFMIQDWPFSSASKTFFSTSFALLYAIPVFLLILIKSKSLSSIDFLKQKFRSPIAPCFFYLALFLAAVQFSDFNALRFRIPAWAILFAISAYALDKVLEQTKKSKMILIYSAAVIITSVSAQLLISAPRFTGTALTSRGYSYAYFPLTPSCLNSLHCLNNYSQIAQKLDSLSYFRITARTAASLSEQISLDEGWQSFLSALSRVPDGMRPYLTFFFAQEIIVRSNTFPETWERFISWRNLVAPPLLPAADLGFILAIADSHWIPDLENPEVLQKIRSFFVNHSKLLESFISQGKFQNHLKNTHSLLDSHDWSGFGMHIGVNHLLKQIPSLKIPEQHTQDFYEGLGAGFVTQRIYWSSPDVLWERSRFIHTRPHPIRHYLKNGKKRQRKIFATAGIHIPRL